MLTLFAADSRRASLSRREFLQVGALGAGLTLADLLRLRAGEADRGDSPTKSIIMIYMYGGPSHIDMYDMKPSAPAEIRGEFSPIQTNVPGMRICEHMPLQGKIADKFSIVNGVRFAGPISAHDAEEVMRGVAKGPVRRPVFGAVASRVMGMGRNGMPRYVAISEFGDQRAYDPGDPTYLGRAHEPFKFTGELANLALHKAISPDRLGERKQLLHAFDTLRRDLDAHSMEGFEAFHARALEMITSPRVRDAFDVRRESEQVRAKYGKGIRFLQARRLVEAGVSVVTVTMSGSVLSSMKNAHSWDTHESNFDILRANLPLYDRYIHTLLTDLAERGLDKDVLVVAWGDMGRTPVIGKEVQNGRKLSDGRNHWLSAGSALFAGGGLKMGQVIGDTGPRGEQDRAHGTPYGVQSVLATVYRVLGIDASRTLPDYTGRPMYILDDPQPIAELL